MNPNRDLTSVNRASGAAIGFLIASVLFIALVVIVKLSVQPPAIDAARDATLGKALAEIRQTENYDLNHIGWTDEPRRIVRLPIETAMQITAREWQNPSQARADLIARGAKTAEPAPKQPAKPNPFE